MSLQDRIAFVSSRAVSLAFLGFWVWIYEIGVVRELSPRAVWAQAHRECAAWWWPLLQSLSLRQRNMGNLSAGLAAPVVTATKLPNKDLHYSDPTGNP